MKMKKRKFLGVLLSLAMMFALPMLLGNSIRAYADDPYHDLQNTTTVVKFDDKDWYLIDYDDSTVTLLAKELVAVSKFDENSNTYSGSTVEAAVNNYYTNSISAEAKKVVNDNCMFLLTYDQADTIDRTNEDVLKCSPDSVKSAMEK